MMLAIIISVQACLLLWWQHRQYGQRVERWRVFYAEQNERDREHYKRLLDLRTGRR